MQLGEGLEGSSGWGEYPPGRGGQGGGGLLPPLTSSHIIVVVVAVSICQGFGFHDDNPPLPLVLVYGLGGVGSCL